LLKEISRLAIAAAAPLSGSLAFTTAAAAITRKCRCARIAASTVLLGVIASLAACGGGSDDGTASTQTGQTVSPTTPSIPSSTQTADQPPTISGTPPTKIGAGRAYRFQPQASGRHGAVLSFRAQNQPAWLALDASTGTLSGNPQPADVGVYRNIALSVTDGSEAASLAPFSVEVTAATPSPYAGNAVSIPGTIDAVKFDQGGEGIGYHDNTAANTGGEFRPDEAVDIRVSSSALDGTDVVNNFETGEWLAYTIDVATAGNYVLWLRASSVFGNGAFHIEINGSDVTGSVAVPNTGDWDTFQWVGGKTLSLAAGRQVLAVVADHQYFDLDAMTVVVPTTAAAPAPQPPAVAFPDLSVVSFFCTFANMPDCNFKEQAEVSGRGSLSSIARDGGTALRLHTEPGDTNVVGSAAMERDDVYLTKPGTADPDVYGEGTEQWWAHSIFFPDDFTVPTWQSYVVFDFHSTDPSGGQANFHVAFEPQADITKPGNLSFIGYGGVNNMDGRYDAVIGQVQKNAWYDFVYHVRWSSGADGFFDAWVNGKHVLSHQGPTLYAGQGVYLKLANYHLPICDPYPACVGTHHASSVIHDRVVRGPTAKAVSGGALEGYLNLVNGVLTPLQ